jgi:hypothetical protein
LSVVGGFKLDGWHIAAVSVEPPVVLNQSTQRHSGREVARPQQLRADADGLRRPTSEQEVENPLPVPNVSSALASKAKVVKLFG